MFEQFKNGLESIESSAGALIHSVVDDARSNWTTAWSGNASPTERALAGLNVTKDSAEIVLGAAATAAVTYAAWRLGGTAARAGLSRASSLMLTDGGASAAERLLASGTRITAASRHAALNPEIASLAPSATERLIASGTPIARSTAGAARHLEIASLRPKIAGDAIRAFMDNGVTDARLHGLGDLDDLGRLTVDAETARAVDRIINSGTPIPAASRDAALNPIARSLRPGR